MFVWLEALTFLIHRLAFDRSSAVSDAKSRDLLLVGIAFAFMLCLVNAWKRVKVVQNLVFAAHVWSFLMVVLLGLYAVLPLVALVAPKFQVGYAATFGAMGVMVVYTPIALRRVYGYGWLGALALTLAMAVGYVELARLLQRYLHPGIAV